MKFISYFASIFRYFGLFITAVFVVFCIVYLAPSILVIFLFMLFIAYIETVCDYLSRLLKKVWNNLIRLLNIVLVFCFKKQYNNTPKQINQKNEIISVTEIKGGIKKIMNRKVMIFLFCFIIITILGCYWLGYLISDFTKDFKSIFVYHRNIFSEKGCKVLFSIFGLIGISFLIVCIIYKIKNKNTKLLH